MDIDKISSGILSALLLLNVLSPKTNYVDLI
jgi:hypothetical protein